MAEEGETQATGHSARELRELQEEQSDFKSLLEHRGFARFMQVFREQLKHRIDKVTLSPLQNINEVLEQEFCKGEIAGITLVVDLIPARLELIKGEIEEILEELENGENV